MKLDWTKRAAQVMAQSMKEAEQRRSNTINVEHLLIALLEEKEGVAADVFRRILRLEPQAAVSAIEKACIPFSRPESILEEPKLSPGVHSALFLAHREAQKANHSQIGTEHMLLGLVSVNDKGMHKIRAELNISPQLVRLALHEQFPEIPLTVSGWEKLKYRFTEEFYHNFTFYVPQPIRRLFGRFLDSSKTPPLG